MPDQRSAGDASGTLDGGSFDAFGWHRDHHVRKGDFGTVRVEGGDVSVEWGQDALPLE